MLRFGQTDTGKSVLAKYYSKYSYLTRAIIKCDEHFRCTHSSHLLGKKLIFVTGVTCTGLKLSANNASKSHKVLKNLFNHDQNELELSLNLIIPPPGHCHRAGFGHRMENGLVRVAPDKLCPQTDGRMDMKTAYALS